MHALYTSPAFKKMFTLSWPLGISTIILCCVVAWFLYRLFMIGKKHIYTYAHAIDRPWQLVMASAWLLCMPLIRYLLVLPSWASTLLSTMPLLWMTMILYTSVNKMTTYVCHQLTEQSTHAQLMPLVASLLKVFIVVIGSLLTLRSLKFDITPLVTSVSVFSIGFALASQDFFRNMFGSLIIFMDQPFRVGDHIVAKDIRGRVEKVGLRSTRIRTEHNSITYVPNAQLANGYVDNHGSSQEFLLEEPIELACNISAAPLQTFIDHLEALGNTSKHVKKGTQAIHLLSVTDSKIQLRYQVVLISSTQQHAHVCIQEMKSKIQQLIQAIAPHAV